MAIIGAGVMGCSLAFHLARLGIGPVLVLDRGAIGQGATAACAGGVRAQFSTEVNVRIGLRARQVLARFDQETGTSASFFAIGYLFLLTTEQERDSFAESIALQRRCGVEDVTALTPAQARALVPGLRTDDLCGASFSPGDGLASPHEVTMGYANAARRLGVRFLEHTPVTGCLLSGGSVHGVATPQGEVKAERTVICAGPWARPAGALAGVDLPILPSRRHIFVTDAFSGITRKTPMTIDFHTSFYFHPEGDGVLFGMGDPQQQPGFDTSVDWEFLERVIAAAQWRWPPLLDARVRTGWAGLYEVTPDNQPLVGPAAAVAGLWMAAGFSGHGFMMAPVVSRLLADWMQTGNPPAELAAFKPDRFERGGLQPETNVV